MLQTPKDVLCQGHLSGISHGSGESRPGDWLQPSSLKPFPHNGEVNEISIASTFGLNCRHSDSTVVLEKEGPQHGIASAELS